MENAPNFRVRYFWGADAQLDSLSDLRGAVTRIRYNRDRQPTGVTLPTGLAITKDYSSAHRQTFTQYGGALSSLDQALGVRYSVTPTGQIGTRVNAAGTLERTFSYDAAGQLRSYGYNEVIAAEPCGPAVIDPDTGEVCNPNATRNSLGGASYSYDAVGNRTNGGAVLQAGSNRYGSLGGFALTYDADGNVTRKAKADGTWDQRLVWNSLGQLTEVNTNGVLTRFRYDGQGRRAARFEPARNHSYLYDGDHAVWEGSDQRIEAEYTFYPGVDRPHSVRLIGYEKRVPRLRNRRAGARLRAAGREQPADQPVSFPAVGRARGRPGAGLSMRVSFSFSSPTSPARPKADRERPGHTACNPPLH